MIENDLICEWVKAVELAPGDYFWDGSHVETKELLLITATEPGPKGRVRVMGDSYLRTFDEPELIERIPRSILKKYSAR